jgi:hypothetical protein
LDHPKEAVIGVLKMLQRYRIPTQIWIRRQPMMGAIEERLVFMGTVTF